MPGPASWHLSCQSTRAHGTSTPLPVSSFQLCPGHTISLGPGCHTWCWATSAVVSRGAELFVCFGRQQWVVSEGMGCDTGDCPVFPCGIQQQQGEDSCPTHCLRIGGRM